MTTIITKNGSGVPTAGQLSEGELAVDLTNKELYTKSGSTVIKIGAQGGSTGTFTDLTATSSFTSPGIDDNATSTAITIDSSEDVGIGTTTPDTILHLKDSNAILTMEHDAGLSSRLYFEDATDGVWGAIRANYGPSGSAKSLSFAPNSSTGDARFGGMTLTTATATIGGDFQQTNLDVLGQVSIKGTYPALDSQTPGQLGSRLVATNGNMLMSSLNSSGAYASDIYKVGLTETGPTRHTWTTSSAGSAMVLLDSGNLGLGTTSPTTKLSIQSGTSNRSIAAQTTTTGAYVAFQDATTSSLGHAKVGAVGNDLSFFAGANERVRVSSTGNVGIGNSVAFQAGQTLAVGDGTSNSGVTVYSGTTGQGRINFGDTTSGAGQRAGQLYYDHSNDSMTISTAGDNPRMTVDASGSVGIGTDTPLNKLVVAEGTGQHGIEFSPGTTSYMQAYDRATSDYGDLKIDAQTIAFGTDNGTERMRINAAGNVLIGKTDGTTNTNGVQLDTATGAGRVVNSKTTSGTKDSLMNYHSGSYVGGVRYTDTATSFPTSSDERLKDNIVDAPAGNIDDLKVRSFDWKANGEHQEYGFVAQELEPVAPYAVSSCGTEDAMLAVDYSKLVPMLVKEIQDLKAEVAALKGE